MTGGGHGYSGSLGSLQNGLEIDMSNFKDVAVDPTKDLMTLGAGVRFRDFLSQLYAAGKAIRKFVHFFLGYFITSRHSRFLPQLSEHLLVLECLEQRWVVVSVFTPANSALYLTRCIRSN